MKRLLISLTIVLMMTIPVMIAVAEPFQVQEGHILPTPLIQACHDMGFEEVNISDWWAAGNIERPPAFVSGFLPGNPEGSIAFWCEKKGEKKVKYYLVFNIKDQKHEMSSCPNVIEWDRRPRGLTIYGDLASSGQGGFEDLLQPGRSIPEEFFRNNPDIMDGYDGFNDIFYCIDGRWLVRHDYDW